QAPRHPLVQRDDPVARLDDVKRRGNINRSRHAWRETMRRRIVIAADWRIPVLSLFARPRLIRKFAVWWIDDDAATGWRKRPGTRGVRLETVVGSAAVSLEQPVQIRFAISRATYGGRRLPRLRPLDRRAERQRRHRRVWSRIPRTRLRFEVAGR